MQKQHLALAFCAVAVLVALVSFARSCGGSAGETATEATWTCRDCGHLYVFTEDDLNAHYRDHYGEPLTCPACDGANVYPAQQCPNCGEGFAGPAEGNRCPHCNQPLPDTPPPGSGR